MRDAENKAALWTAVWLPYSRHLVSLFSFHLPIHSLQNGVCCFLFSDNIPVIIRNDLNLEMNDPALNAQKSAVDFVNTHFTDLESLERVKDVYSDVYKAHEASRQQLEEQVNGLTKT